MPETVTLSVLVRVSSRFLIGPDRRALGRRRRWLLALWRPGLRSLAAAVGLGRYCRAHRADLMATWVYENGGSARCEPIHIGERGEQNEDDGE
jgi:hypothetical protein